MSTKTEKIEAIVLKCLVKLGEEEDIKEFQKPTKSTKIQNLVDSMSLVALSVDIEEEYTNVFGKEIRVLNDEEPGFLLNYESVASLVDYVCNL